MSFVRLSLGCLLTLICACSSLPSQYQQRPMDYQLNEVAQKVRIEEFVSTQEKAKYNEVAMLTCTLGGNYVDAQHNVKSCENKFKNEAEQMGSQLVLIKPEHKRVGQQTFNQGLSGQASTCNNCVDMRGIVLLPKGK